MKEFSYYKIKLHNLSEAQIKMFNSYIDYARYCYNWALEYWNEYYKENGKRPYYKQMTTVLTEYRNDPKHEWMKEFDVGTARIAIRNLERGFIRFFEGQNNHPKFHKKKKSKKSYGIRPDRIKFVGPDNRYLRIPGCGRDPNMLIDCKNHNIPYGEEYRYYNAVIVFDGLNYFLTLAVKKIEIIEPDNDHSGEPIGVDIGIRTTAALSDGTMYDPPDQHKIKHLANRVKKLSSAVRRDLNRRKREAARMRVKYEDLPKSNNQMKREKRLLETRHKLTNIYDTHYRQLAKKIVDKDPEYVVLESFKVRGFSKSYNDRIPFYIGMRKFSVYIEQNCENRNIEVIRAPKDYPSSQICPQCGELHNSGTSKKFICPYCGYTSDRDYNAAINLLDYGKQLKSNGLK